MAYTLDRMELDDIGGKPARLAAEVHRQIRAQDSSVPLPVPLLEIATALGIEEVADRPVSGFDGMLIATPDRSRGAVVLREGMPRGRRAFTLGHELGHYLNRYHQPPPGGFKCSKSGLDATRDSSVPWAKRPPMERMEIEANEFSARLLFPDQEYDHHRKKLSGCDLAHIEPLAKLFGVSKEAMARRYVATAPEMIGIIASKDGVVRSFALPGSFPFLGLRSRGPLPPRCRTREFLKTSAVGDCSTLAEVEAHWWIEKPKRGSALYEQVLTQADGWALTMLLVEEPDEDDAEEGSEVERRWYEPKFSYR